MIIKRNILFLSICFLFSCSTNQNTPITGNIEQTPGLVAEESLGEKLPDGFFHGNMHTDRISALDFSNDGKYLASAGNDQRIQVWDLEKNKVIQSFNAYRSPIYSIDFLSDNESYITGSTSNKEKTIRLWNMNGSDPLFFSNDNGRFYDNRIVKHDNQSDLIISAGSYVCLWDKNGNLLEEYNAEAQGYNMLNAMDVKDGLIAVGGYNQIIYILNVKTLSLIKKLEGNNGEINGLAFHPLKNYLISTDSSGSCKIWNTSSWNVENELQWTENYIQSIPLGFSPDGEVFAAGLMNQFVILNFDNLKPVYETRENIHALAFHPTEKLLAYSKLQSMKIINYENKQPISEWKNRIDPVTQVVKMKDKPVLISLQKSWNNYPPLKLWDLTSGELIESFGSGFYNKIYVTHNDELLAFSSRDLDIWDLNTYKLTKKTTYTEENYYRFAYHEGKNIIAKGQDYGEQIEIRNRENNEILFELKEDSVHNHRLIFNHKGNLLISADGEGINIWDLDKKEIINHIETFSIDGIAISPDDRFMVYYSSMNAVVYDLVEMKESHLLGSHLSRYRDFTFSEDNQYVFAGEYDNRIEIWDLNTGMVETILDSHGECVSSLIQYENRLVTGSWDGTVKMWDIDTSKLLNTMQAVEKDDFLSFTPDFYYTASDDLLDKLILLKDGIMLSETEIRETLYLKEKIIEYLK